MPKFTAGPWNIHHAYPLYSETRHCKRTTDCPAFDYWHCVIAQGETIIGEAHMQSGSQGWPHITDVEEARANTHLIIAAPLMYEALKDVEWGNDGACPQCGMSQSNGEHQPHCILANALAKAEGRVIA